MLTHLQAKTILETVAPDLTQAERLIAQAVSLHETGYGAGWREGHGAGSHNWGAIMRPPGDAGPFFESTDSNPTSTFTGHFKIYPDDSAGALDVTKVALKPNVRAAAADGDVQAVAQGMFDNGYFTGTSKDPSVNVARYRDALNSALAAIRGGTGENLPFDRAPLYSRPVVGLPLPGRSFSGPRVWSFSELYDGRGTDDALRKRIRRYFRDHPEGLSPGQIRGWASTIRKGGHFSQRDIDHAFRAMQHEGEVAIANGIFYKRQVGGAGLSRGTAE